MADHGESFVTYVDGRAYTIVALPGHRLSNGTLYRIGHALLGLYSGTPLIDETAEQDRLTDLEPGLPVDWERERLCRVIDVVGSAHQAGLTLEASTIDPLQLRLDAWVRGQMPAAHATDAADEAYHEPTGPARGPQLVSPLAMTAANALRALLRTDALLPQCITKAYDATLALARNGRPPAT